jgi:hypothetical protein
MFSPLPSAGAKPPDARRLRAGRVFPMAFSRFPSSRLSLSVRRAFWSSPSVLASPPRIGRLPTSSYLTTIILYTWVRGPRFSALIGSDIFTSLRQVLPGRAGTSETRKTTPLLNQINHECSEINPQFSRRFRLLGLALAIDRDSLTSQGNRNHVKERIRCGDRRIHPQ